MLDTQECVKLDVAVAVFVRSVLRCYTQRILKGRMRMPPRDVLLADFRTAIRYGSAGRVAAPHLADAVARDADGLATARECLSTLLEIARRYVRPAEAGYLELVAMMIESGTLSERIRSALAPYRGDAAALRLEAKRVYGELADCLVRNEPWAGRLAARNPASGPVGPGREAESDASDRPEADHAVAV